MYVYRAAGLGATTVYTRSYYCTIQELREEATR